MEGRDRKEAYGTYGFDVTPSPEGLSAHLLILFLIVLKVNFFCLEQEEILKIAQTLTNATNMIENQ